MKKREKRFFSATSAVLAVVTFGVITPSASLAAVKTFTLGFQGPLSGDLAQVGIDQLNGVEYAVKVFNSKNRGKLEVRIAKFDDQGSRAVAKKVASRAASMRNVLGIVGPSFPETTIDSLPYYKKQNVTVISPSVSRISLTDPKQSPNGIPVFHRVSSTDREQGPALYSFATMNVKVPKVVVIDDQSTFGITLVQYLKIGVRAKSLDFASISNSTSDWSEIVLKVKQAAANVVVFTGDYVQAGSLFRQLRDSGFEGVLASGDSALSQSILASEGDSTLEGVRLTGLALPLSEFSGALESDFVEKVGKASGTFTLEAIDSTNIFLSCIKRGLVSRGNMLNCVKNFKGNSISGIPLSFDRFGNRAEKVVYGFTINNSVITYTGQIRF